MKSVLDWARASFGLPRPTDQIMQALHDLSFALKDADAEGLAFTAEARLARTALRSIHWR